VHIVGRYLQILFDGNQICKSQAEDAALKSFETLRLKTFKVKDFFSDAIMFKKVMD